MNEQQKKEVIDHIERGLLISHSCGAKTLTVRFEVDVLFQPARAWPGVGNYIDYNCHCGYSGGVSSRQAKKGITCPLCETQLCEVAQVVRCASCGNETCMLDKVRQCDCEDFNEA